MKKLEKELTAKEIMFDYPEYNVGETPYVVVMEDGIEIFQPKTFFDAYYNPKDEKNESDVRKRFLEIKGTPKEKMLVDELIAYIEKSLSDLTFKEKFDKNEKRLIRFSFDLTYTEYRRFYTELTAGDITRPEEESFVKLILDSNKGTMLADVILEMGRN